MVHIKTKYIKIKYQYLRELVQDKEVRMEYVNKIEHIDDIFTKYLPKDAHEYLRGKLGVIHPSKATWEARVVPYINQNWMLYLITWCNGSYFRSYLKYGRSWNIIFYNHRQGDRGRTGIEEINMLGCRLWNYCQR